MLFVSVVGLTIRITVLSRYLLEDARAVDDWISGSNGKRKVLEWLLELAAIASLEGFDTWSGLEIVRVEKATNLFALFANVVEFVDRDDIPGILFKLLELEFSLKSRRNSLRRNFLAYLLRNGRRRSWGRALSLQRRSWSLGHRAGLCRFSRLNFLVYWSGRASVSAGIAINRSRIVSLGLLVLLESICLSLSILVVFLRVSARDVNLLAILFGCLGICLILLSFLIFMLRAACICLLIFYFMLFLRFWIVHNFLGSLIGSTTLSNSSLSFAFSFLFAWLGFSLSSSRSGYLLHHPILPLQCRLGCTDFLRFALFFIGCLSEDHIAIVTEVATGNDFVLFITAHGGRAHGGVGCNNEASKSCS